MSGQQEPSWKPGDFGTFGELGGKPREKGCGLKLWNEGRKNEVESTIKREASHLKWGSLK